MSEQVVQHSCVHAPAGMDVALCQLEAEVGTAEATPVPLSSTLYKTSG